MRLSRVAHGLAEALEKLPRPQLELQTLRTIENLFTNPKTTDFGTALLLDLRTPARRHR